MKAYTDKTDRVDSRKCLFSEIKAGDKARKKVKSNCPFCGGTKTTPFVRYGKSQDCTDCDKNGKISNRKLTELGLKDFIDSTL